MPRPMAGHSKATYFQGMLLFILVNLGTYL